MVEYVLDDKQKDLLRALVPGLKQKNIGLTWDVVFGARIVAIFETGRINLRSLGWHHAERKDFDQFVEQGFFTVSKRSLRGEPTAYTLDDAMIIRAVEDGFR